jgi:gamma-glutamyltranspeptidase/glutathione hydrolase
LTQSLGPAMGTRLVAPGLGFLYATRLGTTPGSRPASTVAPTIVVGPGGDRVVALGGAGDARIISAVIQVVSRLVDHNMSLADAILAPRVHPDAERTLRVEEGPVSAWSAADRQRLSTWGFTLVPSPSGFFGRVHAVQLGGRRVPALAVAEPRWTGGAAGAK